MLRFYSHDRVIARKGHNLTLQTIAVFIFILANPPNLRVFSIIVNNYSSMLEYFLWAEFSFAQQKLDESEIEVE
jgi:hypothetical protein